MRCSLRSQILEGDALTLDSVIGEYETWVQSDKYMILNKYNTETNQNTRFAVKLSKRGNSVYASRVMKRFKEFCQRVPNVKFFQPHDLVKQTSALFITLTYDTKINNFRQAWATISADYNRFMSNIRKQYGPIASIRCFEAFANGHPHVHLIALFKNKTFDVINCTDDKGKHYNGVKEGVTIETYWHSNVRVQAMESLSDGIRYIAKYITKYVDFEQTKDDDETEKTIKTLALTWLFNKRSFSITHKELFDLLPVLRRDLHTSNLTKQQTLSGDLIEHIIVTVIGIVPAYVIGLTPEQESRYTFDLDEEQFKSCEKYIYDKY